MLSESPYTGFYIQDSKNQIYCFFNQDFVSVGDEVLITGYFERWNDVSMITGVTNIKILSLDNEVKTPYEVTTDELINVIPSDNTYGMHVKMTVLLQKMMDISI